MTSRSAGFQPALSPKHGRGERAGSARNKGWRGIARIALACAPLLAGCYYAPYPAAWYYAPLPAPVPAIVPPPRTATAPAPAPRAKRAAICRQTRIPVMIDGKTVQARARACREPNGSWRAAPG
jgi:hypothetical protein